MSAYGDRILAAREARGWTQKRLADESGVPARTIQEVESGRTSKPQHSTDVKLRRALDLDRNRTGAPGWPDDVKAIVEIVGDRLMAMSPTERIRWVADFSRQHPDYREEWRP